MRRLMILLALIASPAWGQDRAKCAPAPDDDIAGKAYAADGDSLVMLVASKPVEVRIWGIQAPELRNRQTGEEIPAGMASRAALMDLLIAANNDVSCRPIETDRYCRIVADCKTVGSGTTIKMDMLRGGWAYVYTKYAMGGLMPALEDAEAQARKARRGLWRLWLPEHR